ncbi:DarT ssDNA thymidine ADP-ribosyltransferase family protein [Caldicellulosiruptor acetigenus]|uniref:DarT ssDNA thymidine ADP-ribosyltransferase family protein n=1 Tax=Caldicellulosiruptor acetigenus TaxID=301953 RepID=UPI0004170442|nr:DarT ssDNA thymidine ADP-ribosyltransferase family protein [Caldicellulosiruptor acetigenus]WAM37254.1 DUF4433 domain-containing protein [Caldicellulosiruptor acetigenus]
MDEIVKEISAKEFYEIFKRFKYFNNIFIGLEVKNKNFGCGKIQSFKENAGDFLITVKFVNDGVFNFSMKSFEIYFQSVKLPSKKLKIINKWMQKKYSIIFSRKLFISKRFKRRYFYPKKKGYKPAYFMFKTFIEQLRQKYKNFGIYHYTDFTNLESIFKEGFLYSRVDCVKKGLQFTDGADHDVLSIAPDDVKNKVRFYFRPNTPTLFENEGIKLPAYIGKAHMPIPVCLLFDDELILLDTTEFSNGNATSIKYTQIGSTYAFFKSMEWDLIFHERYIEPFERNKIVNRRNSELLSTKPVSLKYLKKVIFRTKADFKRACNLFGMNKKFCVDINYFSDKSRNYYSEEKMVNFILDYNIDVYFNKQRRISSIKLELYSWRHHEDYKIEVRFLDKRGYVLPFDNFRIEKSTNISITDGMFLYVDLYNIKGDFSYVEKVEVLMNNIVCVEEFLDRFKIKDVKINLNSCMKGVDVLFEIMIVDVSLLFSKHSAWLYTSNDERKYPDLEESKIISFEKILLKQTYYNIQKEDVEVINYMVDNKIMKSIIVRKGE